MVKQPSHRHNFDAKRIMRFLIPAAWLMFVLLGTTFLYMISKEFQLGLFYFNLSIYIAVAACVISVISSYFIPPRPRRAIGVKLMMFFGLLPILLICVTYSFSYCLSNADLSLRLTALALMIVLIVGWSTHSVMEFKRRMTDKNFLTKEFVVKSDEIVVRFFQRTSLDSLRIEKNSFFGRFGDLLFPKFILFSLIGYPLQHIFFLSGGMSAVLLLIAVISFPLTTYIIGRMVCGFYLWFYVAFMLEKKHGKPINFFENDSV